MKNSISTISLSVLLFCGTGSLHAGVLLDLEDALPQVNTPYGLTFIAEGTTTDISFAGYDIPNYLQVTSISLTAGGGNLLGQAWTFTPALTGSFANQFDDGFGTGTKGLQFLAVVEDSFDQFDQSVTTVAGQTYTLNFLFSAVADGSGVAPPNELVVSAVSASDPSSVPEPASLALLGLGLSVLIARKKRNR
jgi:hypothetical protein